MDLEEYIQQEQSQTSLPQRLDVSMIWNIMKDITNGVAFIHNHMEVHRDIKPTNGITLLF